MSDSLRLAATVSQRRTMMELICCNIVSGSSARRIGSAASTWAQNASSLQRGATDLRFALRSV